MTAGALPAASFPERGRLRVAAGAVAAAVLGAAPHVLHHAGPLAGAALLGGLGGTLLFGALGLLASIPLLRRLHRRTGGWAAPAGALALFAVIFTLSSTVLGDAIDGSDEPQRTPEPAQHETHHPPAP